MKEKEEKVEQQGVKNQESRVLQICKSLDGILEKLLNRKQYFFILFMVFYALYYVFYVGEYPGYSIGDVIGFAMFYFAWFIAVMLLLYLPYEGALLTIQTDVKLRGRITKSGWVLIILITLIFIILNFLSNFLSDWRYIDIQFAYNVALLLAYFICLRLSNKKRNFNETRIYFLVAIVLYLIISNVSIIKRAGIGNYYANIIVEIASFDRVYLNQKGIKVQDINICEQGKKDKNTQEEKQSIVENAPQENTAKEIKDVYCVDKNIIRFDNIKVLSSIGKKIFLEYKANDKVIKLDFDSLKVKFIKKRNIPIEN